MDRPGTARTAPAEYAKTLAQKRFGAHLSAAGGLEKACARATETGCDCLQIFVKNQRQWSAPELRVDQIDDFRAARASSGLNTVVAHASYLLNLASPDAAQRTRSVSAMIDELQRCEKLGVSALVFHPGAHMEGTLEAGIKRVARALDETSKRTDGFETLILLESTAGQGTAIGYQLSHLSDIIALVAQPQRLGVCLDTCHLFAAGYDFRSRQGYERMMDEMTATIGIESVKCIHVNDSKREAGSRVDRHEHIGKGKIGLAGFAHFVNDKRFFGVPMILETPHGKDGRGTDLNRVNLKRLRALIEH